MEQKSNTAILLIHCPDQEGILAAVTSFINVNKGNILYLDQHVDYQQNTFFTRIEWDLTNFLIPRDKLNEYFSTLPEPLQLRDRFLLFLAFEFPKIFRRFVRRQLQTEPDQDPGSRIY